MTIKEEKETRSGEGVAGEKREIGAADRASARSRIALYGSAQHSACSVSLLQPWSSATVL